MPIFKPRFGHILALLGQFSQHLKSFFIYEMGLKYLFIGHL